MTIKPIAYSYWRRIKANARTYASVPASVKADVKALAILDVQNGIITTDEYQTYIGEEYIELEVTDTEN